MADWITVPATGKDRAALIDCAIKTAVQYWGIPCEPNQDNPRSTHPYRICDFNARPGAILREGSGAQQVMYWEADIEVFGP